MKSLFKTFVVYLSKFIINIYLQKVTLSLCVNFYLALHSSLSNFKNKTSYSIKSKYENKLMRFMQQTSLKKSSENGRSFHRSFENSRTLRSVKSISQNQKDQLFPIINKNRSTPHEKQILSQNGINRSKGSEKTNLSTLVTSSDFTARLSSPKTSFS